MTRFTARTLITTAMLGLGALTAAAEPLSMQFDVYVSGLRVMKVKFNGGIAADSYSGEATMRPKGFAKFFLKKKLDMRVKGRFNDRHARPVSFRMKSRKKGKEKTASLSWSRGLKPSWKRSPAPDARRRQEIDAAIAGGAIDPLSLLFAIGRRDAGNPCAGRARVFDGMSVYDMRLVKVGEEAIRNANYAGPTLKCRLIYIPVAGMSEKKKRKRLKNPPVFTVWLARVNSADAGPIHVPVQAAGRMKGRPFSAILSAASLGGSPLRPASH